MGWLDVNLVGHALGQDQSGGKEPQQHTSRKSESQLGTKWNISNLAAEQPQLHHKLAAGGTPNGSRLLETQIERRVF